MEIFKSFLLLTIEQACEVEGVRVENEGEALAKRQRPLLVRFLGCSRNAAGQRSEGIEKDNKEPNEHTRRSTRS
jgi:hypothetical protein